MNKDTQLPAEVLEEIRLKADKQLIRTGNTSYNRGYRDGEVKGATEYATKFLEAEQDKKFLAQIKEELNIEIDKSRTLLEKVISRHEAGLLPDRFIYHEIKTFLDGK